MVFLWVCAKMKIKKYKIRIQTSVMDMLHGDPGYDITEYYIPRHDLCFNVCEGKLHIIDDSKHLRFKRATDIEEVEVGDNLIKKIVKYFAIEKEMLERFKDE